MRKIQQEADLVASKAAAKRQSERFQKERQLLRLKNSRIAAK